MIDSEFIAPPLLARDTYLSVSLARDGELSVSCDLVRDPRRVLEGRIPPLGLNRGAITARGNLRPYFHV